MWKDERVFRRSVERLCRRRVLECSDATAGNEEGQADGHNRCVHDNKSEGNNGAAEDVLIFLQHQCWSKRRGMLQR
jgi:hypothetical protein